MPQWEPDPDLKAELDDAFQFTRPNGQALNYVTRRWVEDLLAAEYARGVEAGRRQGHGRVISSTGTVG